jgi:hypothetical protein
MVLRNGRKTGLRISITLMPAFYFNADPDPAFHFNPDPAPHEGDANLRPLVYRPLQASILGVHGPPQLLNFDLNADQEPDFRSNADPYPVSKNSADPDPKPCWKIVCI